jgi:hypothetical protein
MIPGPWSSFSVASYNELTGFYLKKYKNNAPGAKIPVSSVYEATKNNLQGFAMTISKKKMTTVFKIADLEISPAFQLQR